MTSVAEKMEHETVVSCDEDHDYYLPAKPQEPDASDCCGTGCTPCVYDIYEQELKLWNQECDSITNGKYSTLEVLYNMIFTTF